MTIQNNPSLLLRPAVLGGVDGVVTSFVIVAGGHAGDVSMRSMVITGVASIIADGLSMGAAEYISSTSQFALHATTSENPRRHPFVLGMACFLSFVVCGTVPLLTFWASAGSILACTMFSLSELMVLGAARTWISKEPLLFGVGQTAVLGAAAGAVAYGVGYTAGVL